MNKGECYLKLESFVKTLNENNMSSYSDYDKLKQDGMLDQVIEHLSIDKEFEKEIYNFLNIIESPSFNNTPALRTIHLYQTPLLNGLLRFEYLLSLYLNNKEAYRVFPLFLLEACKRFNIPKYKDMSLEEIEYVIKDNEIYLAEKYDIKWNKTFNEAKARIPHIKYSRYAELKRQNNNEMSMEFIVKTFGLTCLREEEFKETFSVYAEELTYTEECIDSNNIVTPVAASHGDGFGYDIYTYDSKNMKEKLIEVKSGKGEETYLTTNEYHIMLKTRFQPNTDYYVYKYYYNLSTLELEIYRLKYDKERNLLIDLSNNYEYKLTPVKINGEDKISIDRNDEKVYKRGIFG